MPPPYIPKDAVALLAKIPAIPAPRGDLTELYRRLKALLNRSPRAKLLSILKYTAYIVLLVNFGSLPFVWHSESHYRLFIPLLGCRSVRDMRIFGLTRVFLAVRVFWPILAARLDYWILRFKLVFASKKERTQALIAWGENLSPVGANPFELTTVYRRWASMYFKSMKVHCHADSCDQCFLQALTISTYSECTSATRATPRHIFSLVAEHELISCK